METGDDPEKNKFASSPGAASEIAHVTEGDSDTLGQEPESNPNSLTGEVFLQAVNGSLWANFTALYAWSSDGKSFELRRPKYSAKSNGRRSGNVYISLKSAVETGYQELTDDDGIQDGNWHEINQTIAVRGNSDFVEVYYKYTYDIYLEDDPFLYASQKYYYRPLPPTPTIDPIRNVNSRTFTVSGAGGVPGSGTVILYNEDNDATLGPATMQSNGKWAASVELSPTSGSISIYAKQKVGDIYSLKSASTSRIYLVTLAAPASNSFLETGVGFSGAAAPGTLIRVVKANDSLFALAPEVTATGGIWSTTFNATLPSGSVPVVAQFSLAGYPSGKTAAVTYRVLGILAITSPSANSHQMQTFTLSGNQGLEGASVQVYIEWSSTMVGTGSVGANGVWSASVTTAAGPVSLVAMQTLSGKGSGRSVSRAFKIKPPKLIDSQVSYPSPNTVRFSGVGYSSGARVEIFNIEGDLQIYTNVNTDRSWRVDWNDRPPSSPHQMNARQGVSDGAGGWIYSDFEYGLSITVPVPVPTLTVSVGADRKPVFSGTGHSWTGQPAARVEVRRVGESTPAAPIANVAINAWSSIAAEAWNPGTYFVEARQLFKPAGESSDLRSEPTPSREFTIRAPVPTVEFRHDGLTPRFSGTCLAGGQVQLWFDGDPDSPYDAVVSGTTWSFTRDEPFMPGAYTARVKQSFGGQTSDEVPQPFDIVVLKPVITSPIDEEVDHNPVIRGTGGIPGATMRVHEFVSEGLLDETPVTGNEWSVPILEDLSFGDHQVYAVQQYDRWPSEKSEPVSFTVILFPPTIEYPQPGDAMARVSIIDGYARKASGVDTATVELWLDGADEPLATVRARGVDGYWSYETHLPVGTYTLRAKQFFQGKPSDFGPEHEFTAVPAIPLIESPALQQHLGATATISGHGYVGDWVEVAWSDAPDTLLGRAQVQANRTWSIPIAITRAAGTHSLMVQQECEGYRSGWSAAHEVLLLSPAPTFTSPEAGHWFAGQVFFEGTGAAGQGVDVSYWFDARQLIAQDRPVADGAWTGSPEAPLAPGSHWAKARQSGTDWGDSPRFEVAQVEENPTARAVLNH